MPMFRRPTLALLVTLTLAPHMLAPPAAAQDAAPAAAAAAEVPQGKLTKHTFDQSAIYPGTTREYWLYVPAQYDGSKPACVHVNQDGVQFNAPAVFDQLIAAGEMPVTIGVFVRPGVVPAPAGSIQGAQPRYNRSFEYDTVSGDYAAFLLDELLPHVEKTHGLKLSRDGNDRSIAGNSSGAVCAFIAAWHRPDAFSRVFSGVGTYVGLRGGDELHSLVRKTEPRPIRIFLQDGTQDLNIYAGDWWMANQIMLRALEFAGYEVAHRWDEGGHNQKGATEAFPDAMRFLWKDWPMRPQPGAGSPKLREIVEPGRGWEPVDGAPDAAPAAYQIPRHAGGRYETRDGKVQFIAADGKRSTLDADLRRPTGIALSPDHTLLYVADADTRWVYSYHLQPDGSAHHKQRYFHLHVPITQTGSNARGMCVDQRGWLYVATPIGVQVCDQPGRVNCILPAPGPDPAVDHVRFDGNVLHITTPAPHRAAFSRPMKVRSADPSQPPTAPMKPRL